MNLPKALIIVFFPWLAAAAEKPELINCWDGSFAYTTSRVKELTPRYWEIEMASQLQPMLLAKVALSPVADWGQARVVANVPKTECRAGAEGDEEILTCETKSGSIQIHFDESFEVRKSIRVSLRTLKFVATRKDETITTHLSFDASLIGKGEVELSFTTLGNDCRRLPR